MNFCSIQETLNQILVRRPMSAVSSPNSPPDPGSIHENSNKVAIPTNSIVDITVFPSEITTSIPTGVDDEKDSLNFELTPPFFFIEKEDVDSLHGVRLQYEEHSKLEINGFSELNQIKIGEVQIKLCACSSSLLNATRSLFDRGKCIVISSLTYEKLLLQLLLSVGFDSDFRFQYSFPHLCVSDIVTLGTRKMLVQMPAHSRFLANSHMKDQGVSCAAWQILGNMFQLDIVCLKRKNVLNHQFSIDGRVFDRGKELGTINEYYYFTGDYGFTLGLFDSCLSV
ncbi:uncharacterized protein LOC113357706 [Papaver somniferum]|uniref:uncharacterized protein LOC113357706 n=1 Tax=Papaver somniferum TaxID=3469 RepID=UPI000E6FF402|nr:uncharacterized protein LOC113357706 [Papaver somniferum]